MNFFRFSLVGLLVALAPAAHGAVIFEGFPPGVLQPKGYSIHVLRQGQPFSVVPVPAGASLQIDAKSMTLNDDKTIRIFRGNATATVKMANEVMFSVSAEEIRIVEAK